MTVVCYMLIISTIGLYLCARYCVGRQCLNPIIQLLEVPKRVLGYSVVYLASGLSKASGGVLSDIFNTLDAKACINKSSSVGSPRSEVHRFMEVSKLARSGFSVDGGFDSIVQTTLFHERVTVIGP